MAEGELAVPGPGDHAPEPSILAVVQSGPWETPYRRAGRGHPVLLLLPGTSEARRTRVFASLGGSRLVIEPSRMPALPDRVGWLSQLVEGLGLDRPDVVTDTEGSFTVRDLLLQAPDTLGRHIDIETVDP